MLVSYRSHEPVLTALTVQQWWVIRCSCGWLSSVGDSTRKGASLRWADHRLQGVGEGFWIYATDEWIESIKCEYIK